MVVPYVHRTYVDEILNGVKRDDITVKQSIKFELVINADRAGESGQGHQVIDDNQAAMPGLN